mmetsp:Transcript_27888/g.75365  ORF Transcript_27888/g.75365 Transcript_27888/m.75365 type:complete len:226 (-) Transcript_27888:466-1143(-)|eukprot:CAMPEP_0202370944 /NCGR_PEP_ID=MMETSP1127-20130417/2450_1 /ASSEMBLY_ACC=CAM_ASM_000462 /TAXON_ID=3047 /ORGANISM="Dunaliella tertiolecta, Strain CCMP1320" /LENGTH=225 /DNA_ID=CAMNT_0048967021 /DNA_START=327 /DNA_END=1004 /DNA_ORIENTATION=+
MLGWPKRILEVCGPPVASQAFKPSIPLALASYSLYPRGLCVSAYVRTELASDCRPNSSADAVCTSLDGAGLAVWLGIYLVLEPTSFVSEPPGISTRPKFAPFVCSKCLCCTRGGVHAVFRAPGLPVGLIVGDTPSRTWTPRPSSQIAFGTSAALGRKPPPSETQDFPPVGAVQGLAALLSKRLLLAAAEVSSCPCLLGVPVPYVLRISRGSKDLSSLTLPVSFSG